MNYYERIEKAIEIIEENLGEPLDINQLAHDSCMSLSSLYRIFFFLTGHSVKAYIRKRRLSEAAREILTTEKKIIELAYDYQYESPEAFSRAFKEFFKVSPKTLQLNGNKLTLFERIDIMNVYGDRDEKNPPEVKEIRELSSFHVASCHVIGPEPELTAWKNLLDWARSRKLLEDNRTRFFGFDNDADDDSNTHGYEAWITLGGPLKNSGDKKIVTKEFDGGLYAVMRTRLANIRETWKRFVSWLNVSKYEMANHQWLEEHILTGGDYQINDKTVMDLYMPIKK